MKVSRNELINIRTKLLKGMDKYVRNHIDDECICYDIWFAVGVPDGADETDFREIAADEELWLDCVKTFKRCCELAREI